MMKSKSEIRNKFKCFKFQFSKLLICFGHLKFGYLELFRISDFVLRI